MHPRSTSECYTYAGAASLPVPARQPGFPSATPTQAQYPSFQVKRHSISLLLRASIKVPYPAGVPVDGLVACCRSLRSS